jgi:hypothetical protein
MSAHLRCAVASGFTAEDLPRSTVKEIGTVSAVELAAPVRQQLGLFFVAEETGLEQRRPSRSRPG